MCSNKAALKQFVIACFITWWPRILWSSNHNTINVSDWVQVCLSSLKTESENVIWDFFYSSVFPKIVKNLPWWNSSFPRAKLALFTFCVQSCLCLAFASSYLLSDSMTTADLWRGAQILLARLLESWDLIETQPLVTGDMTYVQNDLVLILTQLLSYPKHKNRYWHQTEQQVNDYSGYYNVILWVFILCEEYFLQVVF